MTETALICLPFGGSGASFFQRWQLSATDGTRVLPVQLPGREDRFVEPPLTDVASAARAQVAGELGQGSASRCSGTASAQCSPTSWPGAVPTRRLAGTANVAGLFVSGS